MKAKWIKHFVFGIVITLFWFTLYFLIDEWIIYESVMPGSSETLWLFMIAYLALIGALLIKIGLKHNYSKPFLFILAYSPYAAYFILLQIFPLYVHMKHPNYPLEFNLKRIFFGSMYYGPIEHLFILLSISIGVAVYYFYSFIRNKSWIKA